MMQVTKTFSTLSLVDNKVHLLLILTLCHTIFIYSLKFYNYCSQSTNQ